MKRFTNAGKSTYHHSAISELLEVNHIIATGVAKGNWTKRYAWASAFSFQQAANESLHSHIG